jgi:DNA (cytosine-5)-methyltransferase 1
MTSAGKPSYRIPSMAEIESIPRNGFNVASTFSGCGGSSLGYRMAGFRILWASEFIPAAQAVYRLNHSGTFLDPRDIRSVNPEEILAACDLAVGELDLLDGSPPCQAFSTAGRRSKNWGRENVYPGGRRQNNELLFYEYIRMIRGLMPRTFVAENVAGLVRGVAKGFFLDILRRLKSCGYSVQAKLLDAQWLGVPQMRQRIIFVGVRSDLGKGPSFPWPLSYRYSFRDALPGIAGYEEGVGFRGRKDLISADLPSTSITANPVRVADRIGGDATGVEQIIGNDDFNPKWGSTDLPHPTITASGGRTSGQIRDRRSGRQRRLTIDELKRICSFPDDFAIRGSFAEQWRLLGNAVPPMMMYHIASSIRDNILNKD